MRSLCGPSTARAGARRPAGVRIATPLLVERIAVRRAGLPVVRTGMGPRRSQRARQRLGDGPLLVAGVGGGLAPPVRVGHLVVATEVCGPDGTAVPCQAVDLLATELQRADLSVHCGPIVSVGRLGGEAVRSLLAATGALAVDMESWWLRPPSAAFAVVRAISDTAQHVLVSPRIVVTGLAALRALRRAVPALQLWAATISAEGEAGR